MKIIIALCLLSNFTFAQNLSPDEQKKLVEENKMLREEIMKSKANPEVPPNMMEALQKGQKFQEDQNKALEELDKDD
ncbi:MAG: hypothetical protein ACJ749_02845 [Flavisolibacter sp.]